jgi:hypothetical protein
MSDRIEELNQRLASRNVASANPMVLFSPRPTPTKYVRMPIVNDPMPPRVKLEHRSSNVAFLPTDAKGPGALDWVDVESSLKNIGFALQRNDRAVYVPSSQSDLYNDPSTEASQKPRQPHPHLFKHVVTTNTGIPAGVKTQDEHVFRNVTLREPVR